MSNPICYATSRYTVQHPPLVAVGRNWSSFPQPTCLLSLINIPYLSQRSPSSRRQFVVVFSRVSSGPTSVPDHQSVHHSACLSPNPCLPDHPPAYSSLAPACTIALPVPDPACLTTRPSPLPARSPSRFQTTACLTTRPLSSPCLPDCLPDTRPPLA